MGDIGGYIFQQVSIGQWNILIVTQSDHVVPESFREGGNHVRNVGMFYT